MPGLGPGFLRHRRMSPETINRCTVSSILGIFTQLALFSIPYFFQISPFLLQLPLSVVVLLMVIILGQLARQVVGVRASAPAFVLFHIVFIWFVYIFVVRQAASPLINLMFNGILALLLIGFFRMLFSDPGFVRCDPYRPLEVPVSENCAHPEEPPLSETGRCLQNSIEEAVSSLRRVRYCKSCKAHVMGFDHHCPAFGNCIGQRNHGLFMGLLVGFISTEALYVLMAHQWMKRDEFQKPSGIEIAKSLAVSTMIFSLVQVFWQMAFFMWHVYCVCVNLRTDEWINWRRYPEFHLNVHQGQSSSEIRFRNPYQKGILSNLKEFLQM